MLRCVNNNYTFAGFWRQWHATLNKWILRYIYIPLGGSSSQKWSMWVIFSFVGLWHDLWYHDPHTPAATDQGSLHQANIGQVALACVGLDQLRLLLC